MVKNLSNLAKEINLHIQEAEQILNFWKLRQNLKEIKMTSNLGAKNK